MGTPEVPMQQFIESLLSSKLPALFVYHNFEHALYVAQKAEEIARHENCTEEEIMLIRTAALWHDVGCIVAYVGHEEESCRLAQHYLPQYKFSANEIEIICGIIRATKIPQTPKTKLEAILADADLEYLSTNTAVEKAVDLFKELQSLIPSLTQAEWNKMQINFLQTHQYFTPYCKEKKEPLKQVYLKELIAAGE